VVADVAHPTDHTEGRRLLPGIGADRGDGRRRLTGADRVGVEPVPAQAVERAEPVSELLRPPRLQRLGVEAGLVDPSHLPQLGLIE
jgi:hypothetical protein